MAGPIPALNALIVCDTVIRDRETNKASLIGIFVSIATVAFPAVHPSLSVYARVIDAQGRYEMRLLVRLGTMETIGEGRLEVDIPDRLRYHQIIFRLNGLRFPAAGQYEFRLYADGSFLGHQAFEVIQASVAQAGGGGSPHGA